MQVMYQRCAGIDVHLRFLVVCLSIIEAGQRRKEIRTFRTETADLMRWLRGICCLLAACFQRMLVAKSKIKLLTSEFKLDF